MNEFPQDNIDPAVAADLAKLMLQLSKTTNKKSRKLLAQAIREAAPDSPHAGAFSDIDIEDKFEKFKEEQAEREVKAQQQAVLERMNSQRNRLLAGDDTSGRKYNEDDVKKIEALMQRKGITDYEDGATLYAATLPPVNPKPSDPPPAVHGATWTFPEFDKFGPDPTKAARETAHQVIGEFMRKRA